MKITKLKVELRNMTEPVAKQKIWTVVNDDDPNETFEVKASTADEAAHNALTELGWWVASDPADEEDDKETP